MCAEQFSRKRQFLFRGKIDASIYFLVIKRLGRGFTVRTEGAVSALNTFLTDAFSSATDTDGYRILSDKVTRELMLPVMVRLFLD